MTIVPLLRTLAAAGRVASRSTKPRTIAGRISRYIAAAATFTGLAAGSASAQAIAPSNSVAPAITGTTTVGQLLTASTGTWSGSPTPTFTYQWRRCDAAGDNCADIASASASTYTSVAADAGSTIRVVVTGTNASGNASATSTQTAIIAIAPANTVAPTISGSAVLGQTLTAGDGTWTGTPTPTLTYQWRRCNAAGNSCTDILGATTPTYVLAAADFGATIRVSVMGTNSVGNASAVSAQTSTVAPPAAPPANTVAPTITGTTRVGQLLSASSGAWIGYPSPTFTYQWRNCDGAGNNCVDIASATASTYTLVSADAGKTIRVVVTATNASGTASATADQTAIIEEPPANTVLPTISGTVETGQLLTANPGTWTGNPTPTLSYQWRRCDSAGNNCADIIGATATTYSLALADLGATIRVVETATNGSGSAAGTSTQTAVVIAAVAAPANTAIPAITGTARVGQLLTASTGTWTGNPTPTFSYQWRSCDAAGNNCSDIASATASTYTPISADGGKTIRVVVTGTNGSGSASATAAQTAAVDETPANTALPTISGTAQAGQLLTANPGTWTGTPAPTYGYQWRRCDVSGANCADIASATASTYTAVSGDVGSTLRVVVTGTNTAGQASATSAQTTTLTSAPAAPSNVAVPSVSGTTTVGQTLTATPGTWNGYPTPTLSYQWRRCDAAGSNCVDIAGATGTTYTLVAADLGATIRVVESGTNGSGTTAGTSTQTAVVVAATAAPANTVAPSITGTPQVAQVLTANPGTWTGNPAPTFTYQWRRCDAAGNNCSDIASATASSYTPIAADAGKTIRVVVTGTNGSGTSASTSTQTAVVAEGPVNTVLPTITGTAAAGQLLTASPGTWTGTPAPTYSYQWRRCDASGASCTDIGGATASTYTAVTADVGATLRVIVTGTNTVASASATTTQTTTITSTPAAPSAPSISGTAQVGQTLTATPGTWTGYPTPTLSYQWRRCDSAGNNCVDIVGATSTTYNLVSADLGATIRVVETATNASGTVASTSSQTAAVTAVSAAPVNTVTPSISGTPQVGQVLTANPGTWTGTPTPTLTYQWQRCDAAGANCVDVAGATASTYTLATNDVGATLRVAVTATNASGSPKVVSAQTSVVAAAPDPVVPQTIPVNTAPPTISGTPEVGLVLTANAGSWNGSPTPTLTYQWQRCDASGATCVNITGATGSTYTLTGPDALGTIRVVVTGANGSGSASASSLVTVAVKAGRVAATRSRVYAMRADSSTALTVPVDSIPADGSRSSRIRVELRDAVGTLLAGRAADITITLDGTATASTIRETATPGIYEFELRSNRVNTVNVSISIDGVTLQDRLAVTFVQATANLAITMSASTETPQIGQTVVFTIEVKNPGPHSATGVEVEHQLSDRVRFVSSEATRGQYDAAKGIWNVGGLALGESAVLKVTVIVTK